ncbi:family A G protein-coupled receptor-like protein [Conidiobolus coronatus NRRL 28638]|uniref:Family A G protein-coupled receptor-like protein n=1 Tax=Conidiobolus coronatus (strain ATCC 28846 / CBS 209.66 / NRRL 28638) TaxID=796925 RepID=A0A137P1J7_CONC2|nr:family A G protein-coupled receptor-like protein [Conidiobolus coronatus NRRL 28638]|eukprot:KXN68936.1 family A G protein-coupled receptor-like protein [Conidiobolus coronatus NRRL 28638]
MSSSLQPSVISDELRDGLLINTAIAGILGVLINSGVIWVLVKKLLKGKAHGDIKLCTFVAVTDIVISFGLIFRSIFAKYPYNIFKYHPNWCKVELGTTGQLLTYSGYSLAVLSIERFLLVCFNVKISVIFWFLCIAVCWLLQFIPAIIGISQDLQTLTKIEIYCTFLPQKAAYIAYIVALVLFLGSYIIIIICYAGITILKFKQCLNQLNLNIPKEKVYAEFRSTFLKSILNICIYQLVFTGKIYTIIYELTTGKKRWLMLDVVSNSLIIYTSVVNTLILLYMNQEVRKSYFDLLKSIKAKLFK